MKATRDYGIPDGHTVQAHRRRDEAQFTRWYTDRNWTVLEDRSPDPLLTPGYRVAVHSHEVGHYLALLKRLTGQSVIHGFSLQECRSFRETYGEMLIGRRTKHGEARLYVYPAEHWITKEEAGEQLAAVEGEDA